MKLPIYKDISVEINDTNSFNIVYGTQETKYLNYNNTCILLGAAIMQHVLAEAEKLNEEEPE